MKFHGDHEPTDNNTIRVLCQHHGPVEVQSLNWAIHFTQEHNSSTGCTPTLTDAGSVVALARDLGTTYDEVSVFWDRGWGDHGEKAAISVITDGNGQDPRAMLPVTVYDELRQNGDIGPNVLQTFKARKLHDFVLDEAVPRALTAD